MKEKIIEYFLIFGNPNSAYHREDDYWKRGYFTFWQFVAGVIFAPLFILAFLLKKMNFKIKP